MITYNYSKLLPLNQKKLLYNIIHDYSKYKEFLPWCTDSFSSNSDYSSKENVLYKLRKLNSFNIDSSIDINNKLNNWNDNNYFTFESKISNSQRKHYFNPSNIEEGTLVVGLGPIQFSYTSIVICNNNSNNKISIEHNNSNIDKYTDYIYSTVETQNNYFHYLDSIWELIDLSNPKILQQKHIKNSFNKIESSRLYNNSNDNAKVDINNSNLLQNNFLVNYEIRFEFKSKLYSNLTELVLSNMGKTLVNSFLARLNQEYELNKHLLLEECDGDSLENIGIDSNIVRFLSICETKEIISQSEVKNIKLKLKNDLFKEYYSKIILSLDNGLIDNICYQRVIKRELNELIY